MDPLRTVIHKFDDWLSKREGVLPFTDEPHVILRLQTGRVRHDLDLPETTIPIGSTVLYLHVWNERVPHIPEEGPDLVYGLRFQHLILASLTAVAQHILTTSSMQDIQAIGGITAHISLQEIDGGRTMFEHLGFTVMLGYRPFGAFGEFWENFYTWWLMWTYNPTSVRHRSIWNLQRTEFWMTRQKFLKRYG